MPPICIMQFAASIVVHLALSAVESHNVRSQEYFEEKLSCIKGGRARADHSKPRMDHHHKTSRNDVEAQLHNNIEVILNGYKGR